MQSKHNCYVPELIFGHFLAGENFDDSQVKFVGGRNGLGAKLTNVFSTKFIIEVFVVIFLAFDFNFFFLQF